MIWKFLKRYYSLKKVGVIIVDSNILPLRGGSIGIALSYCGFNALYTYRNKKDIFGRELSLPQINVADALAASAVLEMGESKEKQPLCIIEGVSKIRFQNRPPTLKEIKDFLIDIKDDPFAPIWGRANWKKSNN
jgi:F420-0:gamma-glutamyl ligase